jgi:hypothetical protein
MHAMCWGIRISQGCHRQNINSQSLDFSAPMARARSLLTLAVICLMAPETGHLLMLMQCQAWL